MSWVYMHFTEAEAARACEMDSDVALVSQVLMRALDEFRDELGARIVFNPVRRSLYARGGHTPGSYHYKGMAADLMFPDTPLLEAFFAATRFMDFGGIGVYPYWSPDPGLHVDIRPARMRAYWWRNQDGTYLWLHQAKEIRQLFTILETTA